ncbi:hypothetical protein R53140_OCIKHKEL_00832 [Fructobacillus fructosus]|uniref:DUF7671 family protein n=1 Tax=Fructobacillus fructosus TaxID=1631 RepID=UPI002D8A6799|nr:hypothetical protein R53140_OCIKHKEL_00832 [Fructobacillus fructosus]
MAKGKYETAILTGCLLEEDASGHLLVKDRQQEHDWRIGKHTKGQLLGPGQIFLTEKNQKVLLTRVTPLSFKDRHDFQPIGRFTKEVQHDLLADHH